VTLTALAACLAILAASLLALWWILGHQKAEAYAQREHIRHLERLRQDSLQADMAASLSKALKALEDRVARLELARLGR